LAASIVIKFRLAENLALGYSDFMDEGLKMLFLHLVEFGGFLRRRLWSRGFRP
jgi:hypothetical protein